MEHFSMTEWIDFVRGIERKERAANMQEHINRGCKPCTKTFDTWRRIMNFAAEANQYEPPAWAVQAVETSFVLKKNFPAKKKLDFATLLFDSALQPVPAGVRGTASVVRQLLYRSGSVCIDMRMQPKAGSESMVLMGQLLDSAKPDHGIGGILVSLLRRGDPLSRSRTNHVGEFDFNFTSEDNLQLLFGIGGSRDVVVPVPNSENMRGSVEA